MLLASPIGFHPCIDAIDSKVRLKIAIPYLLLTLKNENINHYTPFARMKFKELILWRLESTNLALFSRNFLQQNCICIWHIS